MASKLTDKQKKEVIADYIESQNYSETGRKFNMPESTVRNIVKQNKNEEFTKKCEQKAQENEEDVLQAMEKRGKKKIELIDKIFKAMDGKLDNVDMFTNIKDLATAYGIIMDKELKRYELHLKNKELIGGNNNNVQRVQIINDLPKDDVDGTSQN